MENKISVVVREFVENDAAACSVIIGENEKDMGDLYNADELIAASKYNKYWVAEIEGQVAGMVGMCDLKNGIGMLVTLCVSKKFQRRGAGKRMVEEVKKYAKANNFRKVLMLTHENNKAMMILGISQGFVPEGSLKKHFRTGEDVFYFSYFVQ